MRLTRVLKSWRGVLMIGLGAAILLAVAAAIMLRPPPDISAVLRLRPGMTEAEVVEVFGCRHHAGSSRAFSLPSDQTFPGTPKYWNCDAGVVEVRFDANGRVCGYESRSYDFCGPSPFRQLLRLLGF
jgi:hypothetical protein